MAIFITSLPCPFYPKGEGSLSYLCSLSWGSHKAKAACGGRRGRSYKEKKNEYQTMATPLWRSHERSYKDKRTEAAHG
jgi:hypothetical protein